jgi:hypothetical protein
MKEAGGIWKQLIGPLMPEFWKGLRPFRGEVMHVLSDEIPMGCG